MEFSIIYDTELDYFIIVTSDDFDIDEHSKMLSKLVEHSNWRKGKKVLADHRKTSFDSLNMDGVVEVANIVGLMDGEYGPSYCAVVVPLDAFTKATFFKFETSVQTNMKTRIFPEKEYPEAVRWINSQSVK